MLLPARLRIHRVREETRGVKREGAGEGSSYHTDERLLDTYCMVKAVQGYITESLILPSMRWP